MYIAHELFVCGAAAECIALGEIDCRTIGKGKAGPITWVIEQAFHAAIPGKHRCWKEWPAYLSLNAPVLLTHPASAWLFTAKGQSVQRYFG